MEGGSSSCCVGARGSTIRTTPAPPSGTATTRTMPTPTSAFVPAVSLPQHPSPSEPLEGIPAGVHEGSRPAPVIGDPGRSGLNRPCRRMIRTAPAHCPRPHRPTASHLGCPVGFLSEPLIMLAGSELQTLGCAVSSGRLAWSQGARRPKHPPGLAHGHGSSTPSATPFFRCLWSPWLPFPTPRPAPINLA